MVTKKLVIDNIVNSNNIVANNVYAKGDVVVDGDLFVDGNIYLKKGNTIDIGGIGVTNMNSHHCVFNPDNGNIILLGRPDGNIFTKTAAPNILLPADWNKAKLTQKRRLKPTY